ncbi:MAG: hypothetical protein U0795_25165 [Pirellulales bacterium]
MTFACLGGRLVKRIGVRMALYGLAASLVWAVPVSVHAEFVARAGVDQQLFPSYLIATASLRPDPKQSEKTPEDPHHLGDPSGLLSVDVVAPENDTPIEVTVECDEYFEKSVFSGTLAESGVTYTIAPKIKFRYGRLAKCQQSEPISVTFRVKVGDQAEEEQSVTCTMRSINDCPFAFRDGDEVIDTSFAFAAYVNEQHPFVDKLLREALDRGVVTSFRGYQAGTPEDVVLQAYAIWDLLVARDVRYSSITTTAVNSEHVASQHVRLIEDSINNSQANCVDGSVLWVSLLRKIGIDGFLVVTPNHCYAGFYLTPSRDAKLAIETTLLGSDLDADRVEVDETFDNAVPGEHRYEASFYSFVAALEAGTKALAESSAGQDQEASKGKGQVEQVQIIDIARARELGVLPIAFQNGQEFVGYDFTGSTTADESETIVTETQETAYEEAAGEEATEDSESESDETAEE